MVCVSHPGPESRACMGEAVIAGLGNRAGKGCEAVVTWPDERLCPSQMDLALDMESALTAFPSPPADLSSLQEHLPKR